MKKTIYIAAFGVLAGATALSAQAGPPAGGRVGGRGGPGRGGMMADRALLANITLTDAQKAKLEEIRKAEREQMEAQRGQGPNADMEAMRTARQNGDTATVRRLMAEQRAKMDARRDTQIAAIRSILSSDQLATFDANVAEMKKREAEAPTGRMGGRGRGARPPGA
jgi:Spy/CpxP family protein refolding chaperone